MKYHIRVTQVSWYKKNADGFRSQDMSLGFASQNGCLIATTVVGLVIICIILTVAIPTCVSDFDTSATTLDGYSIPYQLQNILVNHCITVSGREWQLYSG